MVEVSQNITLSADERGLSETSCTMYENICRKNFETSTFLDARRIAASKRSLLRTKCRNLSPSNDASPQTPPFSVSPASDIKRLRPESQTQPVAVLNSSKLIRIRNHSEPLPSSKSKVPSTKFICQASLLQTSRLHNYLQQDSHNQLNTEFLFHVDPITEDKVDANLRNEAVHNLRFIHNAFFNLSTETFCKAVNLIDRFIVKVKVKPKYISCVATAAYYMAAKMCESKSNLGIPNPETLVQISRCGGNVDDLFRMEKIIESKLNGDLNWITASEFLRLFGAAAVSLPAFRSSQTDRLDDEDVSTPETYTTLDESDDVFLSGMKNDASFSNKFPSENCSTSLPNDLLKDESSTLSHRRRMRDFWNGVSARLVVALCSLEVYQFTSATLALGIMSHFRVSGVPTMARMCNISTSDVQNCSIFVDELYESHYLEPHPKGRRALIWTLSRRTLFRIGYSSPTPLDTISEDCEVDKDTGLQFSFEP